MIMKSQLSKHNNANEESDTDDFLKDTACVHLKRRIEDCKDEYSNILEYEHSLNELLISKPNEENTIHSAIHLIDHINELIENYKFHKQDDKKFIKKNAKYVTDELMELVNNYSYTFENHQKHYLKIRAYIFKKISINDIKKVRRKIERGELIPLEACTVDDMMNFLSKVLINWDKDFVRDASYDYRLIVPAGLEFVKKIRALNLTSESKLMEIDKIERMLLSLQKRCLESKQLKM